MTVAPNYIEWGGIEGWAPRNLEGPVALDLTRVNPQGIPQAFALSMADVLYFSLHCGRRRGMGRGLF